MLRIASIVSAVALGTMAVSLGACQGTPASRVRVSADEFRDQWPLTMSTGNLECTFESERSDRMMVTFNTLDNTIMYGLNGSARAFGYPDVEAILKKDRTRADLQPLIERGLTLCRR